MSQDEHGVRDIQGEWERARVETAQYLSCAECGKTWAECACDYGEGTHIAAAQEMTGSVARLTLWDGHLQLDDFAYGHKATIFINDELFTAMAQAWIDYKAARDKELNDAIEATRKRRRERPLADCLRFADAIIADYHAVAGRDIATWAETQIPAWRDMGHSDLWIQRRTSLARMCCEKCQFMINANLPEHAWRQVLVYSFSSADVPEPLHEVYETIVRILTALEAPESKES